MFATVTTSSSRTSPHVEHSSTAFLECCIVRGVTHSRSVERVASLLSRIDLPERNRPTRTVVYSRHPTTHAALAGSIATTLPMQRSRPSRPMTAHARRSHVVMASRESGSFWSGVAIGGVVFGVLGFVFAPQISQALLGDDQRLKLPKFLEDEEESPEVTRQNLAEKIAQLNETIDSVSSQLKSNQSVDDEVSTTA